MADFLLAAWFLWMTTLLTALSSLREADCSAAVALAASPASAASRKERTAVLSEDLTPLLRRRAASFVRIRWIWDLMFATEQPRSQKIKCWVRRPRASPGRAEVTHNARQRVAAAHVPAQTAQPRRRASHATTTSP